VVSRVAYEHSLERFGEPSGTRYVGDRQRRAHHRLVHLSVPYRFVCDLRIRVTPLADLGLQRKAKAVRPIILADVMPSNLNHLQSRSRTKPHLM
jgi:hypothetical protein